MDWSNKTQVAKWKDFWKSEMGQIAIKEFEGMRTAHLESALDSARLDGDQERISNAVHTASGVDAVITFIKMHLNN